VKQRLAPWLFLSCSLVVATWLILAHHSRQPFKAFTLTANTFTNFIPLVEDWSFSQLPITAIDPAEPNIMSLSGKCEREPDRMATIRLVHGYNMPMCMKIKGYTVTPIKDMTLPVNPQRNEPLRIQYWRVTSSTGETSFWLTSMIRADTFAGTETDICSMAFPRIDIPDDPNWVPQGLGANLRHPVAALRRWFRSRWNGARTDLLTFLRLRQPAWASDEQLSYVTLGKPVSAEDMESFLEHLQNLHTAVLLKLQEWGKARNR
jgi:hypothetical protein